jgi:hypothetical protein
MAALAIGALAGYFIGRMSSKKDSVSTTLQSVINDTVSMTVTTALNSSSAQSCANVININNCSIDGDIKQNAMCVADISTYQNAVQSSMSNTDITDAISSQIKQTFQNLSLNMTSHQQKLVESQTVNLTQDIRQGVLLNCFNSANASNTITCTSGSLMNGHQIDQETQVQQTVSCIQNSTQNSAVYQQLQASLTAIQTQKEDNALNGSCSTLMIILLAVGAGALIFYSQSNSGGKHNKNAALVSMGMLLLCCAVMCMAMQSSGTNCLHIQAVSNNILLACGAIGVLLMIFGTMQFSSRKSKSKKP